MKKRDKLQSPEGASNLSISDLSGFRWTRKYSVLVLVLVLLGVVGATSFLLLNNKPADNVTDQVQKSCEDHHNSSLIAQVRNNDEDLKVDDVQALEEEIKTTPNYDADPLCVAALIDTSTFIGDGAKAAEYVESYKAIDDAPPLYDGTEEEVEAQKTIQESTSNNIEVIYPPDSADEGNIQGNE